jgi:hypothetical protein
MDLIEQPLKDPINHWYYHIKFRAIQKALKNTELNSSLLIDVGAGSALFSKKLCQLHTGLRVIAVDVNYNTEIENSTDTFQYVTEVPPGLGNVFLLNDVLEHIEDDIDFLSRIVREAPKSSLFIITVPAMMSLWSSHDVFLKHFRRYQQSEVEQLCEISGLSGRKGQYLYGLFYPLAVLQRKLDLNRNSPNSKLTEAGPIINSFVKLLTGADYMISKVLPFGVSYITVKSS